MKLIRHPEWSRMSGQACVAMACGVEFDHVIDLYGDGWLNSAVLVKAIRNFGYDCFPRPRLIQSTHSWQDKLIIDNLNAIVRVRLYPEAKTRDVEYWIYYFRSLVFNPADTKVRCEPPANVRSFLPVWHWPKEPDPILWEPENLKRKS